MNALTLETVKTVARLWQDGASVREIARRVGRSRTAVEGMRRRHAHLFDTRQARITESQFEQAVIMWRDGASMQAMADALGCSKACIRSMISRNRERFAYRVLRAGAKAAEHARQIAPLPEAKPAPKERAEYMPGFADMRPAAGVDSLQPLTLLDLNDRTCRWPISGEGFSTRFCGYCIPAGKIYCEAHRERSLEGRRP
jgi:hypothetical protein